VAWQTPALVMSLVCLRGRLVVVDKSPDGDSIRFAAATPALFGDLRFGDRVEPSADGTVQLRLDGIDTPEVHFNGQAQPLGAEARAELLDLVGFRNVRFRGDEVEFAEPDSIPAAVLSSLVDINGRPIVLLLVGDDLPADGAAVAPGDAPVERTANVALLGTGAGYGTVYETTPEPVRAALLAPARAARDAGRGVWAVDASASFELRSQASIAPGGALILPKLFRRCTDYLRTRMTGETLVDWLRARRAGPNPQDDHVRVDGSEMFLSDLIRQDGRRISFTADVLEILFVD
jgi:endonuclease YncB( thermonuclease family)